MNQPTVQIVAISNVFTRLMHFVNEGDIENGHVHNYDHATMVSAGSVLYEVLDGPNGNTVKSKEFKAPGYVFVEKDKYHRITALEDNTICVCIHALRTIDENIIPPDSFIEPMYSTNNGEIKDAVKNLTGIRWNEITPHEHIGGHHG
jgi:hypothetical protein